MSTEKQFQRLVADLNYPMTIVTVAAGDERSGCLIGFSTQCSIHPPRYLVCVSQRNATYRVARDAELFAVHFLDSGDHDVAELFGEETGDEIDKFEHCRWQPGPGGVPVLTDTAGYFVGRVLNRAEVGDHDAFLLEPIQAERRRPLDAQLGFQDVKDMPPGHKP